MTLVLMAWGIGPGMRSFFPTSPCSTGEVVAFRGPRRSSSMSIVTFNLDPSELERAILKTIHEVI